MSTLDDLDARLIGLLRADGRMPTATLAKQLGVARGTVQNRIERLLREGVPEAAVVVAAHHGSADQLPALYRAIGAGVALIGVGPNDYGHPADEALRILRDDGAEPLRTDDRGTIALQTGPEGVRAWTERAAAAEPDRGDLWTVMLPVEEDGRGSAAVSVPDAMIRGRAPVAQWIEQVPSKHLVAGSIPAGRTSRL